MISKNKILFFSLVGLVFMFIAMNSTLLNICEETSYVCRTNMDFWEHIFYFFPFILFFSLLTFKLKDSVFNAWWKFARVAIPVIFLISLYINLKSNPNGGGWFSIEDQVSLIELVILYSVFVIGSTIQIYRGHKGGSLGPS
ncbi:hypothetical protein KC872_04650 [Candidatus Kaiserbacteria bacterium]|nr:hypothetical protein [Candidatus Kaiserbacteria bacterium]